MAVDVGRKVCVVGRSMRKNVNIARNLGYMDVPDDVLIRPNELDGATARRALILCTGSQGEPLSALTRDRVRRPSGASASSAATR